MLRSRLVITGATLASVIGVSMSAVAAFDRGATGIDRALIIAAGAAVTLAAHVLPALTRGAAARLVWAACLLVVVYGHAAFFAGAASRAGAVRADAVPHTAEHLALAAQLAAISARPTASAAAALAAAQTRSAGADRALASCLHRTPDRCAGPRAATLASAASIQALQVELAAARQADALREQLARSAAGHDTARALAGLDPAAALLSNLTGLPALTLQNSAAMLTAVLVELIACTLWTTALCTDGATHAAATHPAAGTLLRRRARPAAARRADPDQRPDTRTPRLLAGLARALAQHATGLLPSPRAPAHRSDERSPLRRTQPDAAPAPGYRGHRSRRRPADTS